MLILYRQKLDKQLFAVKPLSYDITAHVVAVVRAMNAVNEGCHSPESSS